MLTQKIRYMAKEKLLRHGELSRVTQICGYSQPWVNKYLNDPKNFKGSPRARKEIKAAIAQVIKERSKSC